MQAIEWCHCSHINRANFSQASRGFVSDSWAFLFYSAQDLRGLSADSRETLLHIANGCNFNKKAVLSEGNRAMLQLFF